MLLTFTKMHGSGNDFIVLDGYTNVLNLSKQQIILLANRHIGIGADQILIVEKSYKKNCDFKYRIFNNDGEEVEHCGNGARCFMYYIYNKKLTNKRQVNVEIMKNIISLSLLANSLVEVNMGKPKFNPIDVDFDDTDLNTKMQNDTLLYEIKSNTWIAIASLGNPHAVQIVENLDNYPVDIEGKWLEAHTRFKHKVNAGFMQIIDKHNIKLRVYERGSGETLACGTGACAAVVCGISMGILISPVKVQAKGGEITIIWHNENDIIMQGDANIAFEGKINLNN